MGNLQQELMKAKSQGMSLPKMRQPYNVTTKEGSEAAHAYLDAGMKEVMSWTPKQRFDWLVERGWKRTSIVKSDTHVSIYWEIPEGSIGRYGAMSPTLKQTQAIRCQIWWNMEDKGVIKW